MEAARARSDGAWGHMTGHRARPRADEDRPRRCWIIADELAQIEARDTGKPMSTARNDITVLARYFEYYGCAADKVGCWLPSGRRTAGASSASPRPCMQGRCSSTAMGRGVVWSSPFGGSKRSGHGREKGLLALEELSTTKTLVQYHG